MNISQPKQRIEKFYNNNYYYYYYYYYYYNFQKLYYSNYEYSDDSSGDDVDYVNNNNNNAAQVIPIVISSTGVIPKPLSQSVTRLNLHPNTYIQLQKPVNLGTCSVVRNFLKLFTFTF